MIEDDMVLSSMAATESELEINGLMLEGQRLVGIGDLLEDADRVGKLDSPLAEEFLMIALGTYRPVIEASQEGFFRQVGSSIKKVFVAIYDFFKKLIHKIAEWMGFRMAQGTAAIKQLGNHEASRAKKYAKIISEQESNDRVYTDAKDKLKALTKSLKDKEKSGSPSSALVDLRAIVEVRNKLVVRAQGEALDKIQKDLEREVKSGVFLLGSSYLVGFKGEESVDDTVEALGFLLDTTSERIARLHDVATDFSNFSEERDLRDLIGSVTELSNVTNENRDSLDRMDNEVILTPGFKARFTPELSAGSDDAHFKYFSMNPTFEKVKAREKAASPLPVKEHQRAVRTEEQKTSTYVPRLTSLVETTKAGVDQLERMDSDKSAVKYAILDGIMEDMDDGRDKETLYGLRKLIQKIHKDMAAEYRFVTQLQEFYIRYATAVISFPATP